MMSQELARQVYEEAPAIDHECPDCQSLLTIFYDDKPRYFCENCDQEQSLHDLDRDDGDNNISTDKGLF